MAWGDVKFRGLEEQGLETSHHSRPFTVDAHRCRPITGSVGM
jgi:hypothetical protein